MINRYKIINNMFDKSGKEEVQISAEDRTVLGRKVFSELSKQPGKIKKVLLLSASHSTQYGLHFNYIKTSDGSGEWELLNTRSAGNGRPDRMMKAKTIEKIGAWLMLNRIYDPSGIANLIPNPTPVTADDLKKLLNAMYEFFNPVITIPVSFQQLLTKEITSHLFVSMNYYATKQQQNITHCIAIYYNSWGNMFSKFFSFTQQFSNRIEAMPYVLKLLDIQTHPENMVCYINGKTIRC